jgi:hypothetical protein
MKYALVIIVFSLVLSACSKDPVDDAAKKTALTTGTWKLSASLTDYNKDGVFEEDSYALFAACIKDNTYSFNADGNEITDEGATKCYSSSPQTSTSTWSFTNNQTRLQWGADYQIEELTTTTLRLKARVPYNIIYTIDVRSTYTKL